MNQYNMRQNNVVIIQYNIIPLQNKTTGEYMTQHYNNTLHNYTVTKQHNSITNQRNKTQNNIITL